MHRLIFIMGMLCFFYCRLQAQTFQRLIPGGTAGTVPQSIKPTPDSGFILTGYTFSYGQGPVSAYLTKLNKNGHLQWFKTYSQASGNGSVRGYDVLHTSDDGYVFLGNSIDTVGPQHGILATKTNSNGDILWCTRFGGANDRGIHLSETRKGEYLISGYKSILNGGNYYDALLVKLGPDGTVKWARQYGDTANETGEYVAEGGDGHYYMAGGYAATGTPTGTEQIFLAKTDTAGQLLWTKYYGNPAKTSRCTGMCLTADSCVLVATSYRTSPAAAYPETRGALLIKINQNGDTVWTKALAINGYYLQPKIVVCADSGFTVLSRDANASTLAYESTFLIHLNKFGNIVWQRTRTRGYSAEDVLAVGKATVLTGRKAANSNSYFYTARTDSTGIFTCNDSPAHFQSINTDVHAGISNAVGAIAFTGQYNYPLIAGTVNIGDTVFCESPGPAAVANSSSPNHVEAWPNPADKTFLIKTGSYAAILTVYNAGGQMMTRKRLTGNMQQSIDCSTWPAGMYAITVADAEGLVMRRMIAIH